MLPQHATAAGRLNASDLSMALPCLSHPPLTWFAVCRMHMHICSDSSSLCLSNRPRAVYLYTA